MHFRSIHTLNNVVDYGYFADVLYTLMISAESRDVLKTTLLDFYFPETKAEYLSTRQGGYIQNLQSYLLNESQAGYTLARITSKPSPNV